MERWHSLFGTTTEIGKNPFAEIVSSESIYKRIKNRDGIFEIFNTLEELDLALFEYVNWYNNVRLYGSPGYVPPKEARLIK